MANGIFYSCYKDLMSAALNLTDGNVQLALLTSAYTPDLVNHAFWSDISANEASGTGYTAGGKAISSPTLTNNPSASPNPTCTFSGNPVSWTGLTLTFRYGVVYHNTGTATTSRLIGLFDYLTNQVITSSTFTNNWAASGNPYGILTL